MKHPHTWMEKRPTAIYRPSVDGFLGTSKHTSLSWQLSNRLWCKFSTPRTILSSCETPWSGPLSDHPKSSEVASQKHNCLVLMLQERLLKCFFWESGCELESKSMKFQQTFYAPNLCSYSCPTWSIPTIPAKLPANAFRKYAPQKTHTSKTSCSQFFAINGGLNPWCSDSTQRSWMKSRPPILPIYITMSSTKTTSGWWCNNHLEKYEFVNGVRIIYPIHMKWKS